MTQTRRESQRPDTRVATSGGVRARCETGWNAFWFRPEASHRIARIRAALCFIAVLYFLSGWVDAETWYAGDGRLSASRVTAFLTAAGLESDARWYVSPLFLTDSVVLVRLYLAAGVLLAATSAAGVGGRWVTAVLWVVLVGFTNRTLLVAGLVETLLSLGLFACALAPHVPAWQPRGRDEPRHWTARLARQLIAVQATLFAFATTATMLAAPVWWNGLGSFALAAPAEDRTIDWTSSALTMPIVHDALTHLLVLALPLGVVLAWQGGRAQWFGRALIFVWCVSVALLGSHWLYAAALATFAMTIGPREAAQERRQGP